MMFDMNVRVAFCTANGRAGDELLQAGAEVIIGYFALHLRIVPGNRHRQHPYPPCHHFLS